VNDLPAQIAFAVMSLVTLGGAAGVVLARSVFASALFLILSLFGVAGLYATLDAGFLAVVQILIYVGAISVLFIFAVMLTPQVMGEETEINRQWALGGIFALLAFGTLAAIAYRADWPVGAGAGAPETGTVLVAAGEGGATEAQVDAARAVPGARDERLPGGGTAVRIPGTIERLGAGFVTSFLLPFEVISVVLLVALVGAGAVARG
jgi:NADH-quinone oxidoreductase subunit J